jgi:hypothetical protein
MRRSSDRVHAAVVAFLTLALGVQAQQSDALDSKTKELIEKVVNASDVRAAAKANAGLFKKADRNLLRRLKTVKADGVALRAAWEEMALADGKKGKRKRFLAEKEEDCVFVNPVAAARFLGFVEGRLGIQLPQWWEQMVRDVDHERMTAVWPKDVPYHDVPFANDHIVGMPKTMALKKQGDGALLRIAKDSLVLPTAIVKEYLNHPGYRMLSAGADRERVFLAFHNDFGISYPLVGIDRKTGKKLWESEVWDCGNVGGSGMPFEYVAVVPNGERVFVIGAGVLCFYIEAFDSKTGRRAFRFASRYWTE